MKLLGDVDGDEVSLVKRAANRRRFLLLKGDESVDSELADILDVPWEREGALLDEIRKDGIDDDTVERAVIAAVRLLKGVESEFSPEMIEKLGTELYGRKNPKLNSGGADSNDDLDGTGSGEDDQYGSDGSDGDLSGSGKDGQLIGRGKPAPKVADDSSWNDDDEDDMKKAEFSTDDRKNLAGKGQALPDGSYPIRNKSDLDNAITAYGRAKDKGRAKAWIIRRARALGATASLPDSWGVSKSDDVSDNDGAMEHDDEGGTVEVQVPVQKEDGTWDLSGVPADSRPFYEQMIRKADETESELKATKEKLAKADETLRTREMLQKAAGYSHVAPTDDLAPILKEAAEKFEPETFEKFESLLTAAEERITKGGLFQEMGRSNGAGDGEAKSDAWSEAVKKADEMVEKSDKPMSQDYAIAKVFEAHPELYNQYLSESGMGVSN